MKYSVLCLAMLPFLSHAAVLPTGERIISGDISIERGDRSLYLSSKDQYNVIAWDDFSVSADAAVCLDNKAYLNIVQSDKASVIDGYIAGVPDSRFYLFNPNGITVGKTAFIDASEVTLSTSALDQKSIDNFIDCGSLEFSKNGMGKIKLLGSVSSDNVTIDGSQVIIADIDRITPRGFEGNSVSDNMSVNITSSVKRIDIGGRKDIDFKEKYSLSADDGLVDHTGKKVIYNSEDFLKIKNNPSSDYFIADDINLNDLSAPVTESVAFTGSIDGAFNQLTFNMKTSGSQYQNIGLFSALKNAKISNLKINNASITVDSPASSGKIGALAGTISGAVINNVEINGFDVKLSNVRGNTVYIGAVAGNAGNSNTVSNLIGSFSEKTNERIQNFKSYKAGTLFGKQSGFVEQNGLLIIDDMRNQAQLSYAGVNDSGTELNITHSSKLLLSDNLYTSGFIDDNGHLSNKDFYCPFFIPKDIEITYNRDNPNIFNYSKTLYDDIFNTYDYADVNFNYPSGEIYKPGVYTHSYVNKKPEAHFYFTDGDRKGSSLTHTITIKESLAAADDSYQKPDPDDMSFDKEFNVDMEIDLPGNKPDSNLSGGVAGTEDIQKPSVNLYPLYSIETDYNAASADGYDPETVFNRFERVAYLTESSKLSYTNAQNLRATGITSRLLASLGISASGGMMHANNSQTPDLYQKKKLRKKA